MIKLTSERVISAIQAGNVHLATIAQFCQVSIPKARHQLLKMAAEGMITYSRDLDSHASSKPNKYQLAGNLPKPSYAIPSRDPLLAALFGL